MINFSVSAGRLLPQHNLTATKQIIVTEGTETYTYWYVQDPTTALAFDEKKHAYLVELMHAMAQEFGLAQFGSFSIGTDRNYHLQRLGKNEYCIKSLR